MIYLLYVLISLVGALFAKEKKKEITSSTGFVPVEVKSFISYFHASDPRVSYEVFTFFNFFFSFIAADVLTNLLPIGNSILTAVFACLVWLSSFLLIRRQVKQKAVSLSYKIAMTAEQVLVEMNLQYRATNNLYVSVENVASNIPIRAMREPLLTFIRAVKNGGDITKESEKAKLHYRNKIMRLLIDSLADAITQGGRLVNDFAYLAWIANGSAELAKERKTGSMEIEMGNKLSLWILLAVDFITPLFKPEFKEAFLQSTIGVTILMFTVMVVTWTVISTDTLLSSEDSL